jgi:hypothetical protein
MTRTKTIFRLNRFEVQLHREGSGKFGWAWVPDIVADGLMVAEVTLFGISFVWLGTAY